MNIQVTNITKPEIIIYGGAFDPPHKGHLEAIVKIAPHFTNAVIIIIPANIPASAGKKFKEPKAIFKHRFEMCKLLFNSQNLNISNEIIISSIEEHMPTPNFTIYTLYKLKEIYKTKRLGLLIGEDQFRTFPRWFEPKQILSISDLIVIKRKDTPIEDKNNNTKKSDLHLFNDQCKWLADMLNLKIKYQDNTQCAYIYILNTMIYFFDIDVCDAKSSLIQNLIKDNKSIPEDWITPEIFNYIKNNKLYLT